MEVFQIDLTGNGQPCPAEVELDGISLLLLILFSEIFRAFTKYGERYPAFFL